MALLMVQPFGVAPSLASEASCPANPADPSTVAAWRFDDAPLLSSSSPDSSANGNTLHLHNHASIMGGALFLDGVDDYASAADSVSLSQRDALSVDLCIRPLKPGGGLVGQSGGPLPGPENWVGSWYLLLLNDGRLRFWVSGDGHTDGGMETYTAPIQVGGLYQIRAEFDGAARSVKIWVDGVPQPLIQPPWSSGVPSRLFDSPQPVDVGTVRNSGNALGPFFLGSIDELRIRGSSTMPPNCPELSKDASTMALWHFNDSAPSSDSSGNGNTLTFYGGAHSSNNALVLDGVDDHAGAGDSTNLSLLDTLTVDVCVTASNLGVPILGQYGYAAGWDATWYLYILGDGRLRFWLSEDGVTDGGVETANPVISVGGTHRIQATFDGATGSAQVYVNDQVQAVTVPSWSAGVPSRLHDSARPVRLGTMENSGGNLGPFFAGTIDEVRIQGTTVVAPPAQPAPTRLRVTDGTASGLTLRWDGLGGPESPEQPALTRNPTNAVQDVGPWGQSWEDLYVYLPRVVMDWAGAPKLDTQSRYQMLYTGGQCEDYNTVPACYSGSHDQGGLASSLDGRAWTKHPDNPVLPTRAGLFDEDDVAPVTVVWDSELGRYRAWYEGSRTGTPTWDDNIRIAYAESDDLVNWTNRQLVLGPRPGCFDADDLLGPVVVKDSGAPAAERYKMWYTGHNGPYVLGYATSPDGVTWTPYNCSGTFWESGDPYPSQVFRDDNGVWWMYYMHLKHSTGVDTHLARSADGITWEPLPGTIIDPDSSHAWEARSVYWPQFARIDGSWLLYYNGGDQSVPSKVRIGLAEAKYTRLSHYEVERSTNGGAFAAIGTTPSIYFTDLDVSPGQAYAYWVRAVDVTGQAGPWSEQLVVQL